MAEIRDELASTLAASLNKKFDNAVYVLDGDNNGATVSHWISTGSPMLDLAISNRPHGGLPCGRITEITGLEASGKSLVAAHALASCQKDGGVSVLIDTEWAIDENFLQAIGVNLKTLISTHVDTIEGAFEMIESIIELVRKSDKDKPVTIVLDSIAGASTKTELEATFEKQGYATDKSIIISQAFRKITNLIGREKICLICTNQLRQKMNASLFEDPWISPGGKAVAFHASVRIRLQSKGQIKIQKNKRNVIIGMKTRAKIEKNRCGPPKRYADFDIFFDRGIDDTPSWLERLDALKVLVKGTGGVYTLREDMHGPLVTKPDPVVFDKPAFKQYMLENKNGKLAVRRERIKLVSKDFYSLLKHKPYFDFIYDKVCESEIMEYRKSENEDNNFDPDELIHEDENGEIISGK